MDHALVVQRQAPRELAFLLPGEDEVEILVVVDRTVRVVRAFGLASEPLVVVGEKLRQVGNPTFSLCAYKGTPKTIKSNVSAKLASSPAGR